MLCGDVPRYILFLHSWKLSGGILWIERLQGLCLHLKIRKDKKKSQTAGSFMDLVWLFCIIRMFILWYKNALRGCAKVYSFSPFVKASRRNFMDWKTAGFMFAWNQQEYVDSKKSQTAGSFMDLVWLFCIIRMFILWYKNALRGCAKVYSFSPFVKASRRNFMDWKTAGFMFAWNQQEYVDSESV